MNNKNKAVVLSMLYAMSSYAASNELVITKPHKPSLSSRYHTQFKAALTAIFAVGAVCVYANRQHLDKTSCAALGCVSLSYVHQMTKKQSLLDMLLTHPKAVLDSALALRYQCGEEEERTPESPARAQNILNEFTKKNPLFLLGECTEQSGMHCLLSRRYEPKFRQEFESCVATSLNNKLQSLNRPVQYVGFASGGMFQDLVILTKTLAAKPDARLDVHLIDRKYVAYVNCRDLLGNTRSIHPDIRTNPTPVMEDLKKIARSKGLDISDEELTVALIKTCEECEAPARQSIAWLSKTFPQARLNFYLHDSSDSYAQYIKSTSTPKPDFIAAADMQDERSQVVVDYAQLCAQNPDADNMWLTRNNDYTGASLTSISLNETAGAEKEDIQVQGTSVPVYITTQPIQPSVWRRLIDRLGRI